MIKASILSRERTAKEKGLTVAELPEVKLVSISKDGEVILKFTKDIQFPIDLLRTVDSKNKRPAEAKEDRKMDDEQDDEPVIVASLFAVQIMSYEAEVVSENLTSWRITSITPKEIKIALTFANPLEVSQGDEQDVLSIFANLEAYMDKDGVNLPPF